MHLLFHSDSACAQGKLGDGPEVNVPLRKRDRMRQLFRLAKALVGLGKSVPLHYYR